MVSVFALLVVVATGGYLATFWRSDRGRFDRAGYLVSQVAVAVCISAGFRYTTSLVMYIVFTIQAAVLTFYFEFASQTYLIDTSAVFLAICIFLHSYEKLLFLYYEMEQCFKHQHQSAANLGISESLSVRQSRI
jgi:hypothetical protein